MMTLRGTIITCPNCGAKNRVRPGQLGVLRCSVGHTLLPWIVDAKLNVDDAPELSERY